MLKELFRDFSPGYSLEPTQLTVAQDGDQGVDIQGFNGAQIIIGSGVITDGTLYTFEVKECDTLGGTYTAVADADLVGSEPDFAQASEENTIKSLAYKGNKRFIRVDLVTVTGSPSTGGLFYGIINLGFPRHAPAQSS